MRVLQLLSLVAVVSVGCAVPTGAVVASAPVVTSAPVTVVAAQPDALGMFSGSYAIGGRPAADGCGGQIYLAARTLSIDDGSRMLFADVVNRTYSARVEGDLLIAEGHFEDDATCADGQLFERWSLSRQADGSLVGTLESLWPLPPGCVPCMVVFHIAAVPIV